MAEQLKLELALAAEMHPIMLDARVVSEDSKMNDFWQLFSTAVSAHLTIISPSLPISCLYVTLMLQFTSWLPKLILLGFYQQIAKTNSQSFSRLLDSYLHPVFTNADGYQPAAAYRNRTSSPGCSISPQIRNTVGEGKMV